MKYSLAIDIGASSGRHILGHLENGMLVTEEIYRFANLPKTVNENGKRTLRWDVDALFEEILRGLAKAAELGKIPDSVGIDTWGVDYVLLDKDGKVIDGAYCYRDSRTERSIPRVHEIIPFEKLYAKTGIQFASFNSIYQLYEDKMSGRIASAKTFLMLPDYFHYRLTGVVAHDYTNATTTGMVNTEDHTWDKEIMDALGFDRAVFGELTEPGTTIGSFTDEIAARVGYRARIVLPATHDTASAVVAAPLEGEAPYISSGTWSLLGVEQKKAHTEAVALANNYSNEGAPGHHFRLQINIMGLWLIQQVRHELGDRYSFPELADLAAKSPCDVSFDVNDDVFMAPESMIDTVNRAAGQKLSVGEMAYAIYHNLADGYAKQLSALEKITGKTYPTLNIIGGGSQNMLLNEMTKKATGKRIILGPTEGTAIGNLLMQKIGLGEIGSVAEARAIVKKSFDIKEI